MDIACKNCNETENYLTDFFYLKFSALQTVLLVHDVGLLTFKQFTNSSKQTT